MHFVGATSVAMPFAAIGSQLQKIVTPAKAGAQLSA
jgi:hypothetical protein